MAIGDIDFFKRVNDTYGHECGDLVLKNIAACLKRHMAGKGFAARWGGEEFLLVYDHMDVREAYRYLQRLNFEIHDLDSCFDGRTVRITMTLVLFQETPTIFPSCCATQIKSSMTEKLQDATVSCAKPLLFCLDWYMITENLHLSCQTGRSMCRSSGRNERDYGQTKSNLTDRPLRAHYDAGLFQK